MGLFDSIQDLINGATGSIGDAVGGLTDSQAVQDLQDQASNITDGATDAASSSVADIADQAQNAKDNLVG